jgi:hypothetical protein
MIRRNAVQTVQKVQIVQAVQEIAAEMNALSDGLNAIIEKNENPCG